MILEFSVRALNSLTIQGVKTLGDLVELQREET